MVPELVPEVVDEDEEPPFSESVDSDVVDVVEDDIIQMERVYEVVRVDVTESTSFIGME